MCHTFFPAKALWRLVNYLIGIFKHNTHNPPALCLCALVVPTSTKIYKECMIACCGNVSIHSGCCPVCWFSTQGCNAVHRFPKIPFVPTLAQNVWAQSISVLLVECFDVVYSRVEINKNAVTSASDFLRNLLTVDPKSEHYCHHRNIQSYLFQLNYFIRFPV